MAAPPKPVVYTSDDEKLKRYKSRLSWAKESQREVRQQAEEYIKYYRLKNTVYTKGGQKVIVPTVIANVDAMFAALTAFSVMPTVVQKGLVTYDQVLVAQAALRNEWDEQEVLVSAEPCIKEGLICGIGFIKVGYDYAEETTESEVADEDGNSLGYDDRTEVVRDSVVVDHIPYDDIYFDPEAKSWNDIRWIAHRYELPLEQVLSDDDFDRDSKRDLKRDTTIRDEWRVDKNTGPNIDEERVILYDMYDFETGTVCTFTQGHDKVLKEVPNPFALRPRLEQRNPFVPYISRTDIGRVWGISDVAVMKTMVDEQNVLRSGLATFVDRFKPKLISESDALDEAGKRALRSQEWGALITVRQGGDINSVKPLDMPSIPQEAWNQDSKADADARNAIGLNELLQGQLPVGRKTATGMNIMAQASTVRQSEKRNQLERFYRRIAERMMYLMMLFYDEERITLITDVGGKVAWDWSGEDLPVEFGLSMEVEQKEVLDQAGKLEKFMAIKNIFGPDPAINQQELNRFILLEMGFPGDIVNKLVKSDEQLGGEAQGGMAMEAAQQGMPPEDPMMGMGNEMSGIPGTEIGTGLSQGVEELQ